MTGRVAGKVVLISGAATGIGKSIAVRLAEEGAQVAVADIDVVQGAAVVAEIEQAGGAARLAALTEAALAHPMSQAEAGVIASVQATKG